MNQFERQADKNDRSISDFYDSLKPQRKCETAWNLAKNLTDHTLWPEYWKGCDVLEPYEAQTQYGC